MKKILRKMNTEMLYKIFKIARLEEVEHKLMQMFYVKKQTRDDICEYLNISRSTFTRLKNQAELKIKISLTNLLDDKLNQMR